MDFSVTIDPAANAPESLMAAIIELKRRFAINRTNFNDNISISEVIASIQAIDGVNAVETFKIVNKKFYMNKKFLILDLDMRLLREILKGPKFAHWDNADIGSHIKYYRNPDNYDRALNHALNFLHS